MTNATEGGAGGEMNATENATNATNSTRRVLQTPTLISADVTSADEGNEDSLISDQAMQIPEGLEGLATWIDQMIVMKIANLSLEELLNITGVLLPSGGGVIIPPPTGGNVSQPGAVVVAPAALFTPELYNASSTCQL